MFLRCALGGGPTDWGLGTVPCYRIWTWNFEERENSKSEPGIPSYYDSIFVKAGG